MASFNKKVSINKNVDVILIPTKDEIEENTIDNIWYNDAQLEKIKNEAICEIRVYSMIKNISFKQASKDIYAIE
tara:strand:- start:130 stop:351 length:222 start_codon:yes stop_codon:yes gene_type:complete